MLERCQFDLEHCVLAGEGEGNAGARASVVFKTSLPDVRTGKRGHGTVNPNPAGAANGAAAARKAQARPRPHANAKKPSAKPNAKPSAKPSAKKKPSAADVAAPGGEAKKEGASRRGRPPPRGKKSPSQRETARGRQGSGKR